MGSWIVDIILSAILKVITEFISGIIDKFSKLLNDVFVIAEEVVQGDFVSKLTNYSFKLAISILIFLAISQIIKLYILPEGEDPESDMSGFFIRLGKSAILISFSTVICTMFINFSKFVAKDVISLLSGKIDVASQLQSGVKSVEGVAFGSALATLLILMSIIICLIIICVQAGLRGVNLAILQITAPLFMANYITTDKGLYNKWIQNMFSVSLTYVFQITLTNIGLKFFVNGFENMISVFIGISWLIVTIQSPKLLKEFAYSTGVGSGVSRASSSAMHLIRYLK